MSTLPSYTFTLNANYGLVVLSSCLIAFECIMIGFLLPGRYRFKVFSKQFLEQHFAEIHYQTTNQKILPGGYPDMGSGFFAAKLPYQDWLLFNKAQRVHYNFVEQVASILIFIIMGGIVYPIPASVCGFVFFVARILYAFYVTPKGAQHPLRGIGALLGDFALLAAFIICFISAIVIFVGNGQVGLSIHS